LVGAAWTGRTAPAADIPAVEQAPAPIASTVSEDLLKLAGQQRMNTDIRRQVFVTVMGSEDYVDAVDKLLRLKFKGKQEREVVRVVLDCALQVNPTSWDATDKLMSGVLAGKGV